ncbi:hypothetical protein ACW9IB_08335 [Pseudomonas sp. SDO524_S393]
MSSINAFNPYSSMPYLMPQDTVDEKNPKHNPLDHTAGDDAEVFDPETQSWQPTQAVGKGRFTSLGEAIDFEIKADNMGGWQRA